MLSTLVAVFVLGGVMSAEINQKFWIHNTKFANPVNWDRNRVPCERDRVIFPSDLNLGVGLPPGTTILNEVVLPRNGEMILPSTGTLQIGGGSSTRCPGEDIRFIRAGSKAWLDPANWRPEAGKEFSAPMPHIDRIPCVDDIVMFDKDASFKIELPSMPVAVRSIQLRGTALSNAEWQDWLNSDLGYSQFTNREDERTTVAIQAPDADRCSYKSGCECIAENPRRVLDAVCDLVRPRCTPPPCYYPVTPLGHCCPFCGSYLTMSHDKQFDISVLRSLVNDYLATEEYSNVLADVKKTPLESNTVQIVLVNGEDYQENVNKLTDLLKVDIIKDMDLGVTKVSAYSAGQAITGSKMAQAAKTVFSTFFAVVLFIGTVFYVYVYRQGNPFGPASYRLFQFARFENTPGDDEAALALAIDETTDIPTADNPSQAFDNPMYGAVGEDKQENPVYSTLKRVEEVEQEEEKEEVMDEVTW